MGIPEWKKMKKKKTAKDIVDNKGPRYNYTVRIPPNATPEEIDEFMKEFVAKWKKKEPNEPTSTPEPEES